MGCGMVFFFLLFSSLSDTGLGWRREREEAADGLFACYAAAASASASGMNLP